ncbi:acetyl-CoA carboxylase carboxyltransferase subunit alpha [Christensenellaceae bacterium NSJ-44]|uniref:Acetyl-coenzyme A carboxylase carboxyl transferase subunit alpha n=2 Tax=Luoshenia tenuis TaxID=2763654 RepID=A0A926HHS0_9FIRM|nr:acetyl-CoA carboxylase carboxyltransferase subunit alpha [Luoshenia tenuis]MBC8528002.1 acetyl-CoA carboxylase carboxyltransferase subunit alpha [Luoshenia tenuis]
MTAYERLSAARAKGRPTAQQYIAHIFTDFIELHGDRVFADDAAVIGGIASLCGRPVTVIGLEKGIDTKEKVRRNFGAAQPEGYRKALRLMKQAEKFGRPVVCLVDTAGAYCGLGAEERGQGRAIALNLMEMMALKVPVISILIGEGGSGGALALAVADQVWMLENAVYSVISPEGAASIIWKDASKVEKACDNLKITADELKAFGVVERVFREPEGDFTPLYEELRQALDASFQETLGWPVEKLLDRRYDRFRKFGGVSE